MKKIKNLTRPLVEGAIMVAFATVLSLIKLVDMPYGGSVTFASMLPILIISYRHGVSMGLMTGVVYSMMQQLLGLNTLSYFTTWQSIVAVIVIDYLLAFAFVGLGGCLRGRIVFLNDAPVSKKQGAELALGMLLVCVVRYIFHTVSGATVWAGLSIPTEAALVYSLGYNATYMIPETVINVCAALWIGGALDFSKAVPKRIIEIKCAKGIERVKLLPRIAGFLILLAAVIDSLIIAPYLQDPLTGSFTFAYISDIPVGAILAVDSVLAVASIGCIVRFLVFKHKNNGEK